MKEDFSYKIKLLGEEVVLLPQRAIYFIKEKTLLIADVHLGKTAHFRNAGIPVPTRLAFVDLEILDDILCNSNFEIRKLIVLGDLFHSEINIDWKIFEEWRNMREEIEIILVKGNHDIFSETIYSALNMEVTDYTVFNKFLLVHKHTGKEPSDGLYKICGHVHPAVNLRGKAKQGITLPCFYFGQKFALLPAFGKFTGKYIITPGEDDNVFIITEQNGESKVIRI